MPASRKTASSSPAPRTPGKVLYFNRELSWLAFNRRVLEQAVDDRTPLLERLKFLAIVSSNLDEFFQIRVAGLIQQVDSDTGERSLDGLGPREQLRRIHLVAASLVEEQYRCWHERLVPALRRKHIVFKTARELTRSELRWVRGYFQRSVLPVLTPLAVDASHPFPQLGNKTLNVVVAIDDPSTPATERVLAIVPVPRILPRVVQLAPGAGGPQRFIFLSEIIKLCADRLFAGYRVLGAHAFRVTRNSDLYIDEEESENLLRKIEEELRNLRRGAAVRLEIEDGVDDEIFDRLCRHLELAREYVFRINGPLNLGRLLAVPALIDRPELKDPPFTPLVPPPLDAPGLFAQIQRGDLMLHHPYESFEPVVRFVQEAAQDPQVLAIKQTLYRTSGDSPVVRALIEASQNGKQVTALVELKARFDEANNIQWARQLEEAGVHVVYGVVGLKIHCKCCLVVRQEGPGLRRYVHLGTGNYNPNTARIYTDLSLFTAQESITAEIAQLFNVLTGFVREPRFRRLLVAPYNLHGEIQTLIFNEAEAARNGRPARILAKMNSLVDQTTIDSLYAASRAGVKIDLIVRGVCCLVPGVPGLSENIRVVSIVGRFLEHARAFYFENHGSGAPLVFLGSADWMPRNFFRRCEVVFPVEDPQLRRRVVDDLLLTQLLDTEYARELQPNGAYLPVRRPDNQPSFGAQGYFMAEAELRRQQAAG